MGSILTAILKARKDDKICAVADGTEKVSLTLKSLALVVHMDCENGYHCTLTSGTMSGWTEIIHRATNDSCPHAKDDFFW